MKSVNLQEYMLPWRELMVNRRGQEEAVGFVAIIVIVAIATVFFLGMSLRDNDVEGAKSLEIEQFLEASSRYTTTCSISYSDIYADMGELSRACYENEYLSCFNGMNACSVYNQTLMELIESTFAIGESYAIKGYIFNLTYSQGQKQTKIREISKGSCVGDYKEEELLSPDAGGRGTFVYSLRLCS